MKTILLCGYRTETEPLGLSPDDQGLTLIERRLKELKSLGQDVICVLAGEQADEQLRRAPVLAMAELAYDDSAAPNLLANLRAGLKAAGNDPCFVLPIEIPCPSAAVWEQLSRTSEETAHDVVQLIDADGAPHQFGFPLLVTAAGVGAFKRKTRIESLGDTRLNYLSVVASHPNN